METGDEWPPGHGVADWHGLLWLSNPVGGEVLGPPVGLVLRPSLPALRAHRLAPLACWNLKRWGVLSSDDYSRSLQGVLVQSRHANRVRLQALEEILREADPAGIEILVLKGAALANLVYSEPALRPMMDLDLLVHPRQIASAGELLKRLGYVQLARGTEREVKHVPTFLRENHGVTIAVEVHYDLFDSFWNRSCTLRDVGPDRVCFEVGSVKAYGLAPEQLMRHTWLHLLEEDRLRVIWIADLVGCAEAWVDSLDWNELRNRSAGLVSLLEMLAAAIPYSGRVQKVLREGRCFPQSAELLQLKGWPREKAADWPNRKLLFLLRTLWPSRFWLAIWRGDRGWGDRILNRFFHYPVQLLTWGYKRLIIRMQGG